MHIEQFKDPNSTTLIDFNALDAQHNSETNEDWSYEWGQEFDDTWAGTMDEDDEESAYTNKFNHLLNNLEPEPANPDAKAITDASASSAAPAHDATNSTTAPPPTPGKGMPSAVTVDEKIAAAMPVPPRLFRWRASSDPKKFGMGSYINCSPQHTTTHTTNSSHETASTADRFYEANFTVGLGYGGYHNM